MPVARYFLYVGEVLLALLFVADAWLPSLTAPREHRTVSATIRIHSERKWPERIVLDTSQPTIAPAVVATLEAAPMRVASADPAQAQAREAFAQLQPPDAGARPRLPQKLEPKPQRQDKIARKQSAPGVRLVARSLRYSWFGHQIW
ncbi:MAG TPA: hypothetical protein VE865_13960 [Bradyrhizobium sp.]|nr:hypothetical protein [Bradyrhizobium sp.]